MGNSETAYLDLLPDEIKIYIFSYLNSSDLVNLSTISSLEHLTFEKSLIREISFYKSAKCEMFSFLSNENRREHITSLNITGVYWVPLDELVNGVRQLVNLKCLYAIGTQFEYNATHLKLFESLPQLNTLSLSVRQIESATTKLPNQINKFCLCSRNRHILQHILNSICKSSNLKELWLIQYFLNSPYLLPGFDLSQVSNLKRFVHLEYWHYYNSDEYPLINGMKLTYDRSLPGQLMFEADNGQFNQEICEACNFDDSAWNIYLRTKSQRPFGFKEAKAIMTGLITPSELQCTELNMIHDRNASCNNHRSIVHFFLMSNNMYMLKKLAINFCLCKRSTPIIFPMTENNRKRMRFVSFKSKFDEIVYNCPLIEELEIWACDLNELGDAINGDCFRCISELKNLKKLSLNEFPDPVRGSTLFILCSKLPNLTSLKIKASKPNRTLTRGVAKSLEYSPMLKDLRYESDQIDLDEFFDIVSILPNLKLERFVIQVNSRSQTFLNRNQSLDKFLSRNKQLRFFLIQVHSPSVKTSLENIVNNYKSDWHAYFVKLFNDNFKDMENLTVDNLEMVLNVPMISVLDPFTHYIN